MRSRKSVGNCCVLFVFGAFGIKGGYGVLAGRGLLKEYSIPVGRGKNKGIM